MIDKSVIDPNALQFYRMLKEAGFSAYFVGGSVRDLLLGKNPKDFDIATNATPQQIKRIIPQGRIIGRRFRHVMLEKNGGRYEIVTFRGPVVQAEEEQAELDDEALEDQPVSAEEGAPEENPGNQLMNGNGPDRGRRNYPDLNQFGNAEQDAKRRDFTINALFYDPDADELVDYVEGKLDIDRRLIRSIGDSMQRMEEDPIRILRAIRHKMKLGLDYDSALESAMREKAPLLETTSKDRIREEFLKVCNDHSLGDFLSESRRLGLVPYIMPWFDGVSDESWEQGMRLWTQLKTTPPSDRPNPDLGLALMMVPLIGSLVLEPYKQTLKESEKNYLPDMKYFLSCESLRNFYLRNLRISRAQTDHIVRTLFYYSRMSGLWLEQGPPRRIVGRLFQHPPALLAAKMAKIGLELDGKETPPWIAELADYDNSRRERGRHGRDGRDRDGRDRGDRGPREDRGYREQRNEQEEGEEQPREGRDDSDAPPPRRREERETVKVNRLPPPDQPMVWNGPLHAPVLRPHFPEEQTVRWARKDQSVRAYRPSGIPNPPIDHALLKSNLVYNYKPEIDPNAARGPEEEGGEERSERGGRGRRGGRDRGRGRGRDRGRGRGGEGPRESEATTGNEPREEQPMAVAEDEQPPPPRAQETRQRQRSHEDEDSIGNMRRPGEAPAALESMDGSSYGDDSDDVDDDIGNRLDAPPTSGHVGVNGEGILGSPRGGGRGGHRGGSGGGGGQGRSGGGGRRGGRGRRRGRRGGGGGGGGGHRSPSHSSSRHSQ
ncbi:MAG TPA: CCA tRNA nucleotidyltransferase [Bdellovibrionota bacterium]